MLSYDEQAEIDMDGLCDFFTLSSQFCAFWKKDDALLAIELLHTFYPALIEDFFIIFEGWDVRKQVSYYYIG